MKKSFLFLSLILSLIVFQSCQKDNETIQPNENGTPTDQVAPELPPEGLFFMPFTSFESVDTPGVADSGIDFRNNPTYRNWFYAAFNVVAWSTGVGINLAIPSAAFSASFANEPTYQGDLTWLWTYDVEVGQDIYTANLTGKIINLSEVEWTMKVSKAGGFTDVTWYTGIVSIDFTQANWTVFQNPQNPEPYLNIVFSGDLQGLNFDITYTNVSPNSPENGEFIAFSANDAAEFNRTYDVLNDGNLLEVKWDAITRAGRVKSPDFFNDEEYHCWDSELKDVDCE